jgi:hypothetical protein
MKSRGKLGAAEKIAKERYLASIELRPKPPAIYRLNEDQKVIWTQIVNGQPPGWFTSSQFPLLAQLCRMIDQAATIGEWADKAKEEGKERTYNKWSRSTHTLTRAIQSVANKMRLNISSAAKAKPIKKRLEATQGKVGKAKPKHTPWGRDEEPTATEQETPVDDAVQAPASSLEPDPDGCSSRAAQETGDAEGEVDAPSPSAKSLNGNAVDGEPESAPARPWD